MVRAYGLDLLCRGIDAIEDGLLTRSVAWRFFDKYGTS